MSRPGQAAWSFGPRFAEGGVSFRLWAPALDRVALVIEGEAPRPMQPLAEGWFVRDVPGAGAGTRYRFQLPDGLMVPDPASRFQPKDVHGPSEVVDPAAYHWRDGGWCGRPWAEAVIYELHLGAFTPDGTFRAAIGKLDHLAALGVTFIEIMPVADFPGQRNWGYDGVLPYAPDASYGRPEDLKALVDAAHARGIGVLLDVVYNHFGPDGNYLPLYAPHIFTERHQSPWGAGINLDGPASRMVREFFIQNALYWTREFHLDGLRFDAVHAIQDDSERHLLVEMAERLRADTAGRPLHLILENEANGAGLLERDAAGAPLLYTAQWNDDVHHALHVTATGERAAYYEAYAETPALLGRALAEGFAFQGEIMPYSGHARGEPAAHLPPLAFVAFAQNHDQIGNRAMGERLSALAPVAAVRAASATYLLLPQVPMLFMGEELGAVEPFLFFADFEGALAEAVRTGRRAEFARFPEFSDPEKRKRIPDPVAEPTFQSSKLRWDAADPAVLRWYQRILATRRAEILPLLPRIMHGGEARMLADGVVEVWWQAGEARLYLQANLSPQPVSGFADAGARGIWEEGGPLAEGVLPPWSVRWSRT